MAVYKRFNGKRVKRGDKNYDKGTWYMRFRARGQGTVHRSIPEATTLRDAKLAEQAVKDAIFQRKYGRFVDRTTFEEFVDTVYLSYIDENNASKKTKLGELKFLLPELGDSLLTDITPQQCRNLRNKYRNTLTIFGRMRSPSTVNRLMATLSKIFTLAIQENKIDQNPVKHLTRLKEPEPRNRILSKDEKLRFWEVISADVVLYRLVMIAVHTGLRKGQILAIEAKDIDIDQKLLWAIQSKGRAARYIPLNQTMVDLFKEILGETPFGEIFPFGDFKKRWKNALEKAGIEDFRFHDLKHAFATALFNAGVSRDRIELLFAHSSPEITNRYLHPEMSVAFDAVNRLDDNVEVVDKLQ